MAKKDKKDFEFYAVDEESARAYCMEMAKLGRKATYRYKNGKFIITVWKERQSRKKKIVKDEVGDKYDILDAEAPETYNPAPELFPD